MQNRIRTPALKEFWHNLKEVGTLMSHCSAIETNTKQKLMNESCSRASLLLLCSHMEVFFESFVINILKIYEDNNTSMSELPVQLRCTQAWPVLGRGKEISDDSNTEKKWKFMLQIYRNSFLDDSKMCEAGIFNDKLYLDGFNSPGSGRVEKLFKSIGITEIWTLIAGKQGSSILQKNLDELVKRRNEIAHESSSVGLNPKEAQRIIKDICILVRVFNDVVVEYLTENFSNQNLWDS